MDKSPSADTTDQVISEINGEGRYHLANIGLHKCGRRFFFHYENAQLEKDYKRAETAMCQYLASALLPRSFSNA